MPTGCGPRGLIDLDVHGEAVALLRAIDVDRAVLRIEEGEVQDLRRACRVSDLILPSKASWVSTETTAPGSTVRTGIDIGPVDIVEFALARLGDVVVPRHPCPWRHPLRAMSDFSSQVMVIFSSVRLAFPETASDGQIAADDIAVVQRFRRGFRDDAPLVHDVAALRHGADQVEVLLDEDDRDALGAIQLAP